MTIDGYSSLLCKVTALLVAVGVHVLFFRWIDFTIDPPSLAQPKTTRLFILSSVPPEVVVEAPAVQPPIETPPEPTLHQQQEASPVEIPEVELPPEPLPEPEPLPPHDPEPVVPRTPEPDPEPTPPEETLPPVAEVEQPLAPLESVQSPTFAEPPAVASEDLSDGNFDVVPVARQTIKPEYPLLARQEKWEGSVVCEVQISKRGRVSDAVVVKSSGHDVLDASALKAVRMARFAPAVRRGMAIDVRVRLAIDFCLDDRQSTKN